VTNPAASTPRPLVLSRGSGDSAPVFPNVGCECRRCPRTMSKVRFPASVGRGSEHRRARAASRRKATTKGPRRQRGPSDAAIRVPSWLSCLAWSRSRDHGDPTKISLAGSHQSGTTRPASPNAARHDPRRVCAASSNGYTFLGFLKRLVQRYRRKVILIIDNAPCHNLEPDGRAWLAANAHRIELHRLPAYSPELNAIEGVWKLTRRRTTHNRYFDTPAQRDAALTGTFVDFQRDPAQLDAQVRRFRAPMAA
jgi:transposase